MVQRTRRFTVALVHLIDFKRVLATRPLQDVIAEFKQLRSGSYLRSRDPSQRMEKEPIDNNPYFPYCPQDEPCKDSGMHNT